MPSARVQPKPAASSARGDISDAHVRLIENRVADAVNAVALHRPANPVEFIGNELLRHAATSASVPAPPASSSSRPRDPSARLAAEHHDEVAGTHESTWTAAKWLDAIRLNQVVGALLVQPGAFKCPVKTALAA